MFITIVSHSEGKARRRAHTLIDRYATRIGDNVWTTPITKEALTELLRALRRGASRRTAIAVYRNRGYSRQELIALIGNRNRYDKYGRFALGSSQKPRPWPLALRHIALLAGAGGLSHDLGKANQRFQEKLLDATKPQKDAIRHEWISAWLLAHGQLDDDDVLQAAWHAFAREGLYELKDHWLPWQGMRSGLDALRFLVATHHRLFGPASKAKGGLPSLEASRHVQPELDSRNARCAIPDKEWAQWRNLIGKLHRKLKRLENIGHRDPEAYWTACALIARAALVLADHEVSMREYQGKTASQVFANSKRKEEKVTRTITKAGRKKTRPETIEKSVGNQPLTWHLQEVSNVAETYVPRFFAQDLPALDLLRLESLLTPADPDSPFAWQDKACEFLRGADRPTLVFNVAATGSGKTRANAKMIAALREGQPVRFTAAFNLRILTLQTHRAYLDELGLDETECVCVIGDALARTVFNTLACDDEEQIEEDVETTGFEMSDLPHWLIEMDKKHKKNARKLIGPPVLVSTADYLVACGEPGRQAYHAIAMLRAASSDLILDEADSFDVDSLVALLRTITIFAMFGRHVVVSSATLAPPLAEAIHATYRNGIRLRAALFDEPAYQVVAVSDGLDPEALDRENAGEAFRRYCHKMNHRQQPVTKRFEIIKTPEILLAEQ